MLRLRPIVTECLGRSPRSVMRDVLGVYGVNSEGPRRRSLSAQLKKLRSQPFVRVACVTIRPPGASSTPYVNVQRDLDRATDTFEQSCGVRVFCTASIVVNTGILGSNGMLDQSDCKGRGFLGIGGHDVSAEEDQLFDLGRGLGADIVCYFLPSGSTNPSLGGCAAHPKDRQGFWVQFGTSRWMFSHELGHLLGGLDHKSSNRNLMFRTPGSITATPPELTERQCEGPPSLPPGTAGVLNDPQVERCSE